VRRLALLLLATLLVGCGGSPQRSRDQVIALDTYQVGGDLGFEGTALVKLEPKTLRPHGRRLRLGDAVQGGVFSPDRKRLAFGGYNNGELLLVDPERLELVKKIKLVKHDPTGQVEIGTLGWPRRDLLVALTTVDGTWWAPHPSQLVFVDPGRGVVLRRVPVGGAIGDVSSLPDGTIVLLRLAATTGGVAAGIPVLERISRDGSVRKVALPRLRLSGPDRIRVGGTTFVAERTPGLVTDKHRRVFVVVADRPIAEIDVGSVRVRYHAVPLRDRRLPGARAAPPGSGGVHYRLRRFGTWLGDGLLAVGGFDELPAALRGLGVGHRELATPVQIVDTRTWRLVRTLRATACQARGELILCSGDVVARPNALIGELDTRLVVYDRRWRIRYRSGRPPLYWQLLDGRLLLNRLNGPTYELDPRTGERLRRVGLPRFASGFLVWKPPG
jgi:hypothetical protein